MKIKKFIYIFIFFTVTLIGISFFSVNGILSNAQNFDKNNITQTTKQDFDDLETNIDYKIKSITKYEKNMVYTINYPIFKNNEINNNIYINIEEIINDFRNEFKDYTIDSEHDKIYLTLETDIGFLKNDLLFVRFYINRNYLTYPNPINFYKSYIFNLKSTKEVKVNEIFNDYSQVLFNKSKDYFKNNYGIKIDLNSENYFDIEPKMENYQNIFIKNKFFEFIIFDYKKSEDVIIKIKLDEITPFIKDNVNKTDYTSITKSTINQIENSINTETSILTKSQIESSSNESLTETLEKTSSINNLYKASLKEYNKFSNKFLNNISSSIKNVSNLLENKEIEKNLEDNRSIDPNKPMIALTFDDGPNSKVTNRILDILEKNNARATFFVVGRRLDKDSEILKRMYKLGNEIGNHTYNHKNLSQISLDQITFEVEEINKKLEKHIGKGSDIVRVPYGATNENVLKAVKYPLIMWSVDTKDWKTKNANSIIKEIRKNVKDGDIVLMHDLYETTADACEIIIPELINKGFQLVTVEEMMKYKNIELNPGNKYYNGFKKN